MCFSIHPSRFSSDTLQVFLTFPPMATGCISIMIFSAVFGWMPSLSAICFLFSHTVIYLHPTIHRRRVTVITDPQAIGRKRFPNTQDRSESFLNRIVRK